MPITWQYNSEDDIKCSWVQIFLCRLTLDTAYPPPVRYNPKGVHYSKKLEEENKFDLVYDSRVDGIYF